LKRYKITRKKYKERNEEKRAEYSKIKKTREYMLTNVDQKNTIKDHMLELYVV